MHQCGTSDIRDPRVWTRRPNVWGRFVPTLCRREGPTMCPGCPRVVATPDGVSFVHHHHWHLRDEAQPQYTHDRNSTQLTHTQPLVTERRRRRMQRPPYAGTNAWSPTQCTPSPKQQKTGLRESQLKECRTQTTATARGTVVWTSCTLFANGSP